MNTELIQKWQNDLAELIKPLKKPVSPSIEEINEKWKNIIKYTPPRSFFYLIDVSKKAVLESHGFSYLGYEEEKCFGFDEIVNMIPEFQRTLAIYQIIAVYKIIYSYKDIIKQGGFHYTAQRAIVDKSGEIWNTIQTAAPCRFDENNRLVSYLSWVHITGKYNGEGMKGELFHEEPGTYGVVLEEMNEDLMAEKAEILDELKLGFRHKSIMNLIREGLNAEDIARKIKLTESGVRYHFRTIKSKLEMLFSPREFKTTEEAVLFLDKQQFFTI